jgi:uncharacterized protein
MKHATLALPPFTMETALEKVRQLEALWNNKDPVAICSYCTIDTAWRDRTQFLKGQEEVKEFLALKWGNELNYSIKKELWGFRNHRMAVSFEYEWHDHSGQWYCSYGNELLEFNEYGLLQKRFASINDLVLDKTKPLTTKNSNHLITTARK